MLTRRSLLALPLGLAAMPAEAHDPASGRQPPALRLPRTVQLRPGAAPVSVTTRFQDSALLLRFNGRDAPAESFQFTSWYGYARVFAVRRLRGRDIVLVAFEGNRGTGAYQEIQAVIGQDDDGIARILALETLHYRLTGPCEDGSSLAIRATVARDDEGLVLSHRWRRDLGTCPPRRNRRSEERWTTTLGWTGRGAMAAPTTGAASAARRRVEAARARASDWLATPRRQVSLDELEALTLMDVLSDD